MRPARMPSERVKIVPWYYAERNAPSRAVDKKTAIEADEAASDEREDDES